MFVNIKYLRLFKNALLAILLIFGTEGRAMDSAKNPAPAKRAPAKKMPTPGSQVPKAPKAAPKAPAKKAIAPSKGPKAPVKSKTAPKKAPGKAPAKKAPAKKGAAVPAKKAKAPVKKVAVPPPLVRPAVPPIVQVAVGSDQLQRFQKNPNSPFLFCSSLEPNVGYNPLTNIYKTANVHFSKAPKLHAYNGSAVEILSVKLPNCVLRNLPRGIENESLTVLPQMYFTISTAEHKDDDPLSEQLSFRPHYFVHGDAPNGANPTFNKTTAIRAAIFDGEGRSLGFDDLQPQNAPFVRAEVTTHPHQGDLIVSPPNLKIHGAEPDLNRSYYSSFYTEGNPCMSAITYHWVVKQEDLQDVYEVLLASHTFREFRDTMRERWQRKVKGAMVRELDDLLNGLY